jgi:hypothetical protein
MIRTFAGLIALAIATPVWAQEPVGCDKFKWPLDRERALLANPSSAASGDQLAQPLSTAVNVALVPIAEAKLPTPPTRAPKAADSRAGFLRVPSLPKANTYRVTVSQGAWIDVFQEGREVKSLAFSGAVGCDGVRKSVKFELTSAPFIIELSGTTANTIAVVITPD